MRIKIFTLILLFFTAVLLTALAYVQVVKYEKYSTMSEENRLKIIPLMAPRGSIFDRAGNPLVKDTLCFNVSVIYSRVKNAEALEKALSSMLAIPQETIAAGIRNSRGQSYLPVCIAADIGMENAVRVEEAALDYPGLLLEVSAKREYMHEKTASNLLGYLGFINRPEFEKLRHYGYKINDLVGRDGIEKQYDKYLRGIHGGKQIEVDSRGREKTILGFKEPVPGRNIYLTIDLELQKFCESLLQDKRGAILALDPQSGAVLAMASAPSYDPSVFVTKSRRKEAGLLLKDRMYPLLNRAIAGVYPPGSIFKVVIAAAALENGVISQGSSFDCEGSFSLGKAVFRCWKKKGHGQQILVNAIKNSCNVYFFRTGLLLGAEKIAAFAEKYGFGKRTGVDLPGERAGTLPTPGWKKKRFNEAWYKGDTVNYSIGQGYMLCSPLQVARMMCVYANRGYLVRPYLVSRVGDVPVGSRDKVFLYISPKSMETVREGMRKVVNDPHGTGQKAKQDIVIIAGKTGTAQVSRGGNHGWFAGFAPFEDAKLVVVVFDEHGGKGGYYAASTAGSVFKKARELGII